MNTEAGPDVTTHRAFEAAEHLAPAPATRDEATAECWARHYTALAFAAFTALHDALMSKPRDVDRLDFCAAVADPALAAAVAFAGLAQQHPGEKVAGRLWGLTPELGALNGEWEGWLADTLDRLGINPADINPRDVAADFRSPAVLADVSAVTR